MIFVTSILSVHGATSFRLYLFFKEAYLSKVSYTVFVAVFDREEIPKKEREKIFFTQKGTELFYCSNKKVSPFLEKNLEIICLLER